MQNLTSMAATIRKAVSYPAYAGSLDAHTDGMAELISHLTGQPYDRVRADIVAAADADKRTPLEASKSIS